MTDYSFIFAFESKASSFLPAVKSSFSDIEANIARGLGY